MMEILPIFIPSPRWYKNRQLLTAVATEPDFQMLYIDEEMQGERDRWGHCVAWRCLVLRCLSIRFLYYKIHLDTKVR